MKRCLRLVAATALTLGTCIAPFPAQAQASPQIACRTGFGTKTPVLLVHGFNSDVSTWNTALNKVPHLDRPTALTQLPGIVLDTFQYGGTTFDDKRLSDHWVTEPGIGPLLAQKIQCLSNASSAGGGNGKVIVIAHSMGGLAMRCALDLDCAKYTADIESEVGLVITFDTPNLGSFLEDDVDELPVAERLVGDILSAVCTTADFVAGGRLHQVCFPISAVGTSDAAKAFVPNSTFLKKLPPWPGDVPLYSMAGRITLTESFGTLWHRTLANDIGDLVVGTTSAVDLRGTPNRDRTIEDCGVADLSRSAEILLDTPVTSAAGAALFAKNFFAGVTCSHGTETSVPGFLSDAARRIRTWLQDNPAPVQAPPTTQAAPPTSTPPSTTSAPPDSVAADTPCSEFLSMSADEELNTIRQMIADLHLTGAINSPQLTWASARAMCSIYPPDTPIKRIYSG